MFVKKDAYREIQVRIMLERETNDAVSYNANLSHWAKDSKPINVEADVLAVLADAYAGKYVEVNDDTQPPLQDTNYFYWTNYEYEDEGYFLFFVMLPHLNNRDVVRLLCEFDRLYGDTDQETTEWSLEFQILTRMLTHNKALLVNPKYLDLTEAQDLIAALLPDEDKAEYLRARTIPQETIREMFRES